MLSLIIFARKIFFIRNHRFLGNLLIVGVSFLGGILFMSCASMPLDLPYKDEVSSLGVLPIDGIWVMTNEAAGTHFHVENGRMFVDSNQTHQLRPGMVIVKNIIKINPLKYKCDVATKRGSSINFVKGEIEVLSETSMVARALPNEEMGVWRTIDYTFKLISLSDRKLFREPFDTQMYNWASRIGSETAYQSYLNRFPNGIRASEVKNRIKKLRQRTQQKWEFAKNKDTVTAYNQFLSHKSTGHFADKARHRINELIDGGIRKAFQNILRDGKPIHINTSVEGTVYDYRCENGNRLLLVKKGQNGNTSVVNSIKDRIEKYLNDNGYIIDENKSSATFSIRYKEDYSLPFASPQDTIWIKNQHIESFIASQCSGEPFVIGNNKAYAIPEAEYSFQVLDDDEGPSPTKVIKQEHRAPYNDHGRVFDLFAERFFKEIENLASEKSSEALVSKSEPLETSTLSPWLVKNANGIIYDSRSNLEWFVGVDEDISWKDAQVWVKNLNVQGDGWRLPTIKELRGLYIKGMGTINIDPIFKTTGLFIWSNETYEKYGSLFAWYFNLGTGTEYQVPPISSTLFRAFSVRSRR